MIVCIFILAWQSSPGYATTVTCPALSNTAQALVDAAGAAKRKQNFAVAARCTRDAIEMVKDNAATSAGLHNDLGLLVFADPTGGPVPALEHFVRAGKLAPNFANAHFNAAVSSAKAGDHKNALQWFKQCLDLQPQNAMYYHQYAASLMENSHDSAAVEALQTSLRHDNSSAEAHNLMGVVKSRQKNYTDATRYFQSAVDLQPASATFCANLATANLESAQFERAHTAFQRSLALMPSSAEFYHGIAKSLEGMDVFPHDQLKEAMKSFKAATSLKPNSPLFQYDLCSAAFKLLEIKPATEACEKGVKLAPGYAPLRFQLGRIHEEAGRDSDALESFRVAVAIDPANKQYSFALRSVANAAGGGKGSLGSQKQPPPPNPFQQQPPAAAVPKQDPVQGIGGQCDDKMNALEAKIDAVEQKVMAKLQNLYSVAEALSEKLNMIKEAIDHGNTNVMNRLNNVDTTIVEIPQQMPEGHLPPHLQE